MTPEPKQKTPEPAQSKSATVIYLFKINNGNTWTTCEVYSKLTVKTRERRHWLVSLLLTLNRFYTFFRCSYWWIWTSMHQLRMTEHYCCRSKVYKVVFGQISVCFLFLLKLWICLGAILFENQPLKRQLDKMVKHTQTSRRLLPTNCFSVFNHLVGLSLKRLK